MPSIPKLNAEWHRAHRMPKNPTQDQRINWHIAHAAACSCRPIPDKLKAEILEWKRKERP